MDDSTRIDADSEDVEAHGMKEAAAAGLTAAALAAGAGAASAHAASSPDVNRAPDRPAAAALNKFDATIKVHSRQNAIIKFFKQSWSRTAAVNKLDRT